MENPNFEIVFFVVWLVFVATVILGFHVLHSLFMVLKENDNDLWIKLGKPYCKLSIPIDKEKMSIPPNVVIQTYKWGFVAPQWVKVSEKGKKVYLQFRIYALFNILVAFSGLFAMYIFLGPNA